MIFLPLNVELTKIIYILEEDIELGWSAFTLTQNLSHVLFFICIQHLNTIYRFNIWIKKISVAFKYLFFIVSIYSKTQHFNDKLFVFSPYYNIWMLIVKTIKWHTLYY